MFDQKWFRRLAPIMAAFVGLIHFGVISQGRLKTSPDSVNYLFAAHSLLSGQGYRGHNGEFLYFFPPGYPATLAAVSPLTGFDLPLAAFLVNGMSLFGALLLAGKLAQVAARGSIWASLAVILALGLNFNFVFPFLMVWSEGLFLVLALATIYVFVKTTKRPDSWAWSIGLLLVLAGYVRTSGAFLALSLFLVASLWRRWRLAVTIFGSVLVLTIWQVASRVWQTSGTMEWGASDIGWWGSIGLAWETTVGFLTSGYSLLAWPVLVGVALVVFGLVSGWSKNSPLLVAVAAGLISAAAMVVTRARIGIDGPDFRTLHLPFTLLIIVIAVGFGAQIAKGWQQSVVVLAAFSVLAMTIIPGREATTYRWHEDIPTDPVPAICSASPADLVVTDSLYLALPCYRYVHRLPRTKLYNSKTQIDETELYDRYRAGNCVVVVWAKDPNKEPSPWVSNLGLRITTEGNYLVGRSCG